MSSSYRFIPTCVGNTVVPSPTSLCPTVHPHVCGEYFKCRKLNFIRDGSSPRVWGIPGRICIDGSRNSVHPHVCGEYIDTPPRFAPRSWFIPTCVGNTHGFSMPVSSPGGSSPRVWGILPVQSEQPSRHLVHPHVCGEYALHLPIKSRRNAVHPHVCGEYITYFCLVSH